MAVGTQTREASFGLEPMDPDRIRDIVSVTRGRLLTIIDLEGARFSGKNKRGEEVFDTSFDEYGVMLSVPNGADKILFNNIHGIELPNKI